MNEATGKHWKVAKADCSDDDERFDLYWGHIRLFNWGTRRELLDLQEVLANAIEGIWDNEEEEAE